MKKAILTLLMIPAFVGMLFSCSEVKTDAKKLEGKWNIVEVKGEKILKEGLPNMEFDMATTMMACPDMETEDAILKAMGDVKGVKAGQSENEMLLVDADGNVLMVLSKN